MTEESQKSRRTFLKSVALASGAATLGGCQTAEPTRNAGTSVSVAAGGVSVAPTHIPTVFPRHNERTKGWLRFLWQKATTPDDWSYRGDEALPWGIRLERGPIDFTVHGTGPLVGSIQQSALPALSAV